MRVFVIELVLIIFFCHSCSAVQVDSFTVSYKTLDSLVSFKLNIPSCFLTNLTFIQLLSSPLLSSPPQLAKEVEETLSLVQGRMEQSLANSLFPVYLSLQAIHKEKAFLQRRSVVMLRSCFTVSIQPHFSL